MALDTPGPVTVYALGEMVVSEVRRPDGTSVKICMGKRDFVKWLLLGRETLRAMGDDPSVMGLVKDEA